MESSKEYILDGLCCGNCAAKIEEEAKKLPGIVSATVNFVSKNMVVTFDDSMNAEELTAQISKIAKRHDSGIEVSENHPQKAFMDDATEKKKHSHKQSIRRLVLIIGAAVYATALLVTVPEYIALVLFLISYIFIGGDVVWQAIKNISHGQVFDENFLMAVATIGAFLIGEYPEGVAVMLFYQVGEAIQKYAVNRSRDSITSLMDIRPDFANLKTEDGIEIVSPEEISVGDVILVKPGEKVPLDGEIIDGASALDTSALTGESLPRDVMPGDEILSGSVNQTGLLSIRVTKAFKESTVSKILDLVENASGKKAKTESFITRFAKYYTPVVTFCALALAVLPPLFVPGAEWSDWIYRALAFLVVSCPCALVISVPLSFFGGIGGASREGILVKGGNYLELLDQVGTIVMDKTGTLTKGKFEVSDIFPMNDFSREDVLKYAAVAESNSNHPIAQSIVQAYGTQADELVVSQKESAGYGVEAVIGGHRILAGNAKMMTQYKIACPKMEEHTGTQVYVAVDETLAGIILITDEIKKDSRYAIQKMKKMGVEQIVMLTGDSEKVGKKVAGELGIDAAYTELLPQDKVEIFEKIISQRNNNKKTVFVGDGINDAPVLARADIGIAMGALGSDAAIEAADVVLMTDEPSKIATAICIARKTKRIVWENILFAMGIKILVLILAALGTATMWEAVFGDVGVTVLAVLNSMRAMRVKNINMQD